MLSMAQKRTIQLIDDLDGTEASETLTFALDGVTYEIDLSEANARAARETFAAYITAGRRTGGRSTTSSSAARRSRSDRDYVPQAVRAWASSNKIDVPARGRIPATVLEQYRAAGN